VWRVEALRRAGGAVICRTRALGQSPADARLVPGQGMLAASARAQSIARHRRGQRHAARAGGIHGLRGAPSGDRSRAQEAGGGQARDERVPDEARLLRQGLDGSGRDRLTLGEVGRRLPQAGARTRTGKTVWARSAVWGLVRQPASRGTAAFGTTRPEPRRPRRRAPRGRALPPRRAVSPVDVPGEAWCSSPGPALVEPDVCAPVQDQGREQQRHARPSRRGALALRPGVRQGQPWGEACEGKRLRPSARKGKPRASASSRGLGTAAYRFGGERRGQHTPGRTERLALAVWQAVRLWLAHPERLAED
jgi:site-specific DNA recombinase